jgi:hypothetical protein
LLGALAQVELLSELLDKLMGVVRVKDFDFLDVLTVKLNFENTDRLFSLRRLLLGIALRLLVLHRWLSLLVLFASKKVVRRNVACSLLGFFGHFLVLVILRRITQGCLFFHVSSVLRLWFSPRG